MCSAVVARDYVYTYTRFLTVSTPTTNPRELLDTVRRKKTLSRTPFRSSDLPDEVVKDLRSLLQACYFPPTGQTRVCTVC